MNPELVQIRREGPAAVLTLNRPEKRNALSRSLVATLGSRLAEAASDQAVRVIVLAGAGPVFCAGLDLDELAELRTMPNARDQMQHGARQLAAAYRALSTCAKPTIARVHGPAVAGGAGLVTACDLAIATPRAKFGYPEVLRGIMPAIITPMLLRLVGDRAAKHLLLTGKIIEADAAARLGIYNMVVPAESLEKTVGQWVHDLARGGPETLAGIKQWIDRCSGNVDLWVESADASAAARFSPESDEGITAFQEKRLPRWAPTEPTPG